MGESFSEGATVLPQSTPGSSSEAAMAISAMHLVYLDSNQCKLRGKNPHHTQGQTQAEYKSSAPNRVRASDTHLRDCVGPGCAGTASLLLKCAPSMHWNLPGAEGMSSTPGNTPSPWHTHHSPTPTSSSKHLGLKRITS